MQQKLWANLLFKNYFSFFKGSPSHLITLPFIQQNTGASGQSLLLEKAKWILQIKFVKVPRLK